MSEQLKQKESEGKQYPVRRICYMCNRDLGEADYTSEVPGETTGAECDECLEKHLKDIEEYNAKRKKKNKE